MSASPAHGERPQMQGAFRRSFTLPARQLSVHERAGLDRADANADILYSHPIARIIKFSPPTDSIKTSSKAEIPADTDYPVDTVETLPWRSRTETLAASGQMIIEKVRGSTNFLKCQNVMHAILRNSQCWCVDGESKFVLRIQKFQYYRIELPSTTEEDKTKVEELKKVLPTVLRYERTPCPFIRAFTVELPEDAITPRRKGQWKRRDSSQPNTPDTDTETPPLRRTNPTRSWSLRSPPTAYPKNGPNSTFEDERGRPSSSAGLHRRASLFENHRNSSPASYVASEDGNDSEYLGSEHDSEVEAGTNRSQSSSPRKHLESVQQQSNETSTESHQVVVHPLSRALEPHDNAEQRPVEPGEKQSLSKSGKEVESSSQEENITDAATMQDTNSTPIEAPLVASVEAKKVAESNDQSAESELNHTVESSTVEDVQEAEHSEEAVITSTEPSRTISGNISESNPVVASSADLASEDVEEAAQETSTSSRDSFVKHESRLTPISSDIPTSSTTVSLIENAATTQAEATPRSSVDIDSESKSELESESSSSSESESESESEAASASGSESESVSDTQARHVGETGQAIDGSGSESTSESESETTTDSDAESNNVQPTMPSPNVSTLTHDHAVAEGNRLVDESSESVNKIDRGATPSTPILRSTETSETLSSEHSHEISGQDEDNDDVRSTISSSDSFHTMASPRSTLSRTVSSDVGLGQSVAYPRSFPVHSQHKREWSEVTVTTSNVSDPVSPEYSSTTKQHDQIPQDRVVSQSTTTSDSPPESGISSSVEQGQGLRERLQPRRSFSPLPPPSTIFSEGQIRHDSGRGHMTKVILQKLIIAPIEVASMIIHIMARIAGGASLNDLLTGELFKRPEHRRRVSGFADQLNGGRSASDTEDDYGIPVRGRRRSTERRLAMALDDEDGTIVEDID